MDVRPYGADTIVAPFAVVGGGDAPVVARMSRMRPRGELFRGGVVGGSGSEGAFVPVQYAMRVPTPAPLGSVFVPGSRANEDFVRSTVEGFRAFRDSLGSIVESKASGGGLPPGSKPINQTPWSGNHGEIKEDILVPADGKVMSAPNDDVWSENPAGSWTNHGPAGIFVGSGRPRGRNGKDR